MFFSMSMSVQSNRFASPLRIAVSFSSCKKAEFFLPEPAINASSSFSSGINGNFLSDATFWFFPSYVVEFQKLVVCIDCIPFATW